MDAITQLFESYLSRRPSRSQALARPEGGGATGNRRDRPRQLSPGTRGDGHAAMLSGMCLANSGLIGHGVAPALGVHCRVPHGAACALMLPAALR